MTEKNDRWLERLCQAQPGIEALDARGSDITDDGLRHLQHLPALRSLSLRNTAVTDVGLARLSGVALLEKLDLTGTRVRGAGLAALSDQPLRHLWLRRCPVGDESIRAIVELSKLDLLDLRDSAVTDAALVHVAKLGRLRRLYLPDETITDAGLAHLKELPRLKHVYTGYVMATDNRRTPPLRIVELGEIGGPGTMQWEGKDVHGGEVYIRYRHGLLSVNWGLFAREYRGGRGGEMTYEELIYATRGFLIFDHEMTCPHCTLTSPFEDWLADAFCPACGNSRHREYGPRATVVAVERRDSTVLELSDDSGVRYLAEYDDEVRVSRLDAEEPELLYRRRFDSGEGSRKVFEELQTEIDALLDLWRFEECASCQLIRQLDQQPHCPRCTCPGNP